MKKRFVFVTLLIAMVVLTLMPVSLVRAEDTGLEPISGSNCDPTTFTYQDHTVAEGFAASVSADLPMPTGTGKQVKFGCAVAGLADTWDSSGIGFYNKYTPYVDEMWVKVTGEYPYYTAIEDSIYDNTGTGGSSCDFFSTVLLWLEIAFAGYDIYSLLKEVYQEPPVQEWDADGHWSKAIVRQQKEFTGTQWVVNPSWPRLQTGSANVLGTFSGEGPQTLNITAEAEINVQIWEMVSGAIGSTHIGTYRVSFEVSVPVGVYDLSVRTYLTTGEEIFDVKVWIDDDLYYSWVTTQVGYGTHSVIMSCLPRNNHMYVFQYWEGGSTSNPKIVNVVSDIMLRAYYDTFLLGDFNFDGKVDVTDYDMFVEVYSSGEYDSLYDLNGDDFITGHDVLILIQCLEKRFLTISTTYGGTTDPTPETRTYILNSQATVTATANVGYTFQYWLLDGTKNYDNPITVLMDSDHTLKAHFEWVNIPPNTPSTPSGPTSGYPSTSYTYSTSTTDPDGDYVRYQFYWGDAHTTTTGWYLSGFTASKSHSWGSSGTYYVKVRAQDYYGAWSGWSSSRVVSISSGGGGGCPTLYVWDGADYVCEGLLDIHNPEGIDVIYGRTLVTTPQCVNGAYLMRLTEHPQTHSYIDQVKLYATLENGTTIELPLIHACHSEDGNVLPQLLHSDEWKADTLGADHNNGVSQSIDLKFAAQSPNLEIVGFVFQIEGNNIIIKDP